MTEFTMPSAEEIANLQAKAHEMRAEAVRESFSAFAGFLAHLPGRVAQVLGLKTTA